MTESSEGGPSVVGGVAGGGGVNGAADVGASDPLAAAESGSNGAEGGGTSDPPRPGDEQKALLPTGGNGTSNGALPTSPVDKTSRLYRNICIGALIAIWLIPLVFYVVLWMHSGAHLPSLCDDTQMQSLLRNEKKGNCHLVPCANATQFNTDLISSILDGLKEGVTKRGKETSEDEFSSFVSGLIRYHRALGQVTNQPSYLRTSDGSVAICGVAVTLLPLLKQQMRGVQCKALHKMEGTGFSFPLSLCPAIEVPDNATMTIEEFTEYSNDVATRYRFAEVSSLFYSFMRGNLSEMSMEIASEINPDKWKTFLKPIEERKLDRFLTNNIGMENTDSSSSSQIGTDLKEYMKLVVLKILEKLNHASQTNPLPGETWDDFISLPFLDRKERLRSCTRVCRSLLDSSFWRGIIPSSYLNDSVINSFFWTSIFTICIAILIVISLLISYCFNGRGGRT